MRGAAQKLLGWVKNVFSASSPKQPLFNTSQHRRTFKQYDSPFLNPPIPLRKPPIDPKESSFKVFKFLFAAAPVIFFREMNDDASKRQGIFQKPEPDPAPQFSPDPKKRLYFTGTGGLVLGLGTLGVLAYTQPKTQGNDDTSKLLRGLGLKVGSNPQEQLPYKRKLFQNLQDMFNLAPESQQETKAPASTPKPSKAEEPAKTSFERLVIGDGLVLTEGDITNDQWKALSTFLESCPHIRSLRLQGMEISARDADELGPGLKQIQHITFCDNHIGLHEGSLDRLVALLLCCGLLESTSIIRNSLSDSHTTALVQLMKHPKLTRVSVCWNGIGDRGAEEIADALVELNTRLKDIDLSYNSIGWAGKSKLWAATQKRFEHFGRNLQFPIAVHLRHNERFSEFTREFKEPFEFSAQAAELPWYLRRSFKENFNPRHKKPKK